MIKQGKTAEQDSKKNKDTKEMNSNINKANKKPGKRKRK